MQLFYFYDSIVGKLESLFAFFLEIETDDPTGAFAEGTPKRF